MTMNGGGENKKNAWKCLLAGVAHGMGLFVIVSDRNFAVGMNVSLMHLILHFDYYLFDNKFELIRVEISDYNT